MEGIYKGGSVIDGVARLILPETVHQGMKKDSEVGWSILDAVWMMYDLLEEHKQSFDPLPSNSCS
eukprot:10709856-Ditylum_brightwellii.AAC.1